MCAESSDHIVYGQTRCRSVGEDARDKRAKATLMFARGMGPCGRSADERSNSTFCLDHPATLQFRVYPRHRIRIHLEINCELAHGGQLITWPQSPCGDRRPESTLELHVYRCRVVLIERDK
jgi:hypothetical protein